MFMKIAKTNYPVFSLNQSKTPLHQVDKTLLIIRVPNGVDTKLNNLLIKIFMKLKHALKFLLTLSKEELNQELVYNSKHLSISGLVGSIKRQPYNLYNTHEDDPATLYTLSELKDMDMDKEEIESCDIEIPKGSIVITF